MSYDELVRLIQSCDIPDDIVIEEGSRLREDLCMSSFTLMVLIVRLEEYLQREIDPVNLEASITVSDLLTAINSGAS